MIGLTSESPTKSVSADGTNIYISVKMIAAQRSDSQAKALTRSANPVPLTIGLVTESYGLNGSFHRRLSIDPRTDVNSY